MAFYLDGSKLVSDATKTEYQVKQPFQKVLETLPEDEPVPSALILLGILTEQLDPVDASMDAYIQVAEENISETPTAAVSARTVKGIQWLLSETQESLTAERKRKVGELIAIAQINSPGDRSSDSPQGGLDNREKTDESSKDSQSGRELHNSTSHGESINTQVSTSNSPKKQTASDNIKSIGQDQEKIHEETSADENNLIECDFCGAGFSSEGDVVSHSIRCEERPGDAIFRCEHCGNKYVSKSALENHLSDCSSNGATESTDSTTRTPSYECESCGELFDSPQELIVHKKTGSKSGPEKQRSTDLREQPIERDATGTVTEFNSDGGYGFINTFDVNQQEDSESVDVFFHVSEYPGYKPEEDERLRFDVKRTEDGFRAMNISQAHWNTEPFDETFSSTRSRWGRDT